MNRPLLLISFLIVVMFGGCSSKKETASDPVVETDSTITAQPRFAPGSDEEQIYTMINNALIRLSYGDKSDLYELEYEYFTDETSFDDYLKMGQITYAQMDSILRIDMDSVMFFGEDSAWAIIEYVFKDWEGKEKSRRKDRIVVYKHKGRWIKPTVTVLPLQYEYEARINAARRAAEQEAEEESGGK